MTSVLTEEAQAIRLTLDIHDQPYKGLNYYSAADSHLFAERDDDIERCADILGSTHVLFLHGRSGVGKSSFLRAGLVPFIEGRCAVGSQGFDEPQLRLTGIRVPGEDEALILRCTEDPVRRLYLKLGGRMSWTDESPRANAKETATLLFQRARDMISRCPLYFVIDQAEDILTLNSRGSPSQQRLVALIDILRFRGEVKLILVLRTEFFGNFLDLMSISPAELGVLERRSETLPPLSGVDMFLLDSIREHSRLVNIIEFPTTKLDRYHFKFEDGLALKMAEDLNTTTSDFNLLPTLQVVCKELYDDVVLKHGRDVIRTEDYISRGEIRGGIDGFINRNLNEVLTENRRTSGPAEIGKWKTVLGSLVGRSEGGSVVGFLKRAASIEGVAQWEGVGGADDDGSTLIILQALAQERRRVLRVVPDMEGGDWYGLGHDALAQALFAWVDAAEKIEAERRKSEDGWRTQKEAIELERNKEKLESKARIAHARYFSLGATLLVACTALGYLFSVAHSYKSVSDAALDLVNAPEGPDFRVGALRLAQASKASEELLGFAINQVEIEVKLRELLLGSPVWAAVGPAVAAEVWEHKALFIRGNSLLSQALPSNDGPLSVGRMPDDWADEVGPASVGFVADIPVVVRGRRLFYQKSSNVGATRLDSVDLTTVVPESLANATFWPDVSGGAVRLYYFSASEALRVVILTPNDIADIASSQPAKRKTAEDVIVLGGAGARVIPLFAQDNKQVAMISGGIAADTMLTRGFVQSTDNWLFGSQIIGTAALRRPEPDPSAFAPSATFVGASGALLVRDGVGSANLFSATDWSKKELKVGQSMEGFVPSAWAFMRPPLAAFASDERLRAAWAISGGIAVGEVNFDGDVVSLIANMAWGQNPPQRISFPDEFERLYGVSRTDQGQQQGLYWDFSPERRSELESLSGITLVSEACRVVSLVGATTLIGSERLQAIPIDLPEPCQK